MPWKIDLNGEKHYKPSIYNKDELPTWDEIYNSFISNRIYHYNMESDTDLDPYWRIPQKVILLGFICNQLNKMIFEDGRDTGPLLQELGYPGKQIRFKILPEMDIIRYETGRFSKHITDVIRHASSIPPIYHCRIPFTMNYSIFTSNHPHIDLTTLNGSMMLTGIIHDSEWLHIMDPKEFDQSIAYMFSNVIKYFEKQSSAEES